MDLWWGRLREKWHKDRRADGPGRNELALKCMVRQRHCSTRCRGVGHLNEKYDTAAGRQKRKFVLKRTGLTVRPVLLKKNRDSVTSENSRFAFLFCYRRLASALGPHVALFARDLESQQNTTTHASLPMNTSILIGDCRRLFARSCNTPRNQDSMVRRRSAQSHWHDGRGSNWWGATSIRQSHILLSTLWR
jgi:hypothetical protein